MTAGILRSSIVYNEAKELAWQSVLFGVSKIGAQVGSMLVVLIGSHWLSRDELGALGVTAGLMPLAIAGLSAVFASGAIKQALDYEDPEEARGYLGTVWLASLAATVGVLVVLLQASTPVSRLLFGRGGYETFFRLSLLGLFFQVSFAVPQQVLRLRERILTYALLASLYGCLYVGLSALVMSYSNFGLIGIAIAQGLAGLICYLGYLSATVSLVRPTIVSAALQRSLRFGLPLLPYVIAGWVVNMSGRVMLPQLHGLSETGLYTLGYTIGASVEVVVSSVNMAWVTYFFRNWRDDAFPTKCHRIVTLYLTLIVLLGFTLSLFATTIVELVAPPGLRPAAGIVPWTALIYCLNAFQYLWVNVLYLQERTTYIASTMLVAAFAVLAGNLILIPRLGMYGAALSSTIGFSVLVTTTFLGARGFEQLRFDWGTVGSLAALSVALFALVYYVDLRAGTYHLGLRVALLGCVVVAAVGLLLVRLGIRAIFSAQARAPRVRP